MTEDAIVDLVTAHFLDTGEGMTRKAIEKVAGGPVKDLPTFDRIGSNGPRWAPTIRHLRTLILAAR